MHTSLVLCFQFALLMQFVLIFWISNLRNFQFSFRAWINFKSHTNLNIHLNQMHQCWFHSRIIYWWNLNGVSYVCKLRTIFLVEIFVGFRIHHFIAIWKAERRFQFIPICNESAHNRILLFWNCANFIDPAFETISGFWLWFNLTVCQIFTAAFDFGSFFCVSLLLIKSLVVFWIRIKCFSSETFASQYNFNVWLFQRFQKWFTERLKFC